MKNSDIDSYLWLCTLEAIEKGVETHKIQELCKCQIGLSNNLDIKINHDKTGDK